MVKAIIKAGTIYQTPEVDRLSEEKMVEVDTEAEVIFHFASKGAPYNTYWVNGTFWYVRPENEA